MQPDTPLYSDDRDEQQHRPNAELELEPKEQTDAEPEEHHHNSQADDGYCNQHRPVFLLIECKPAEPLGQKEKPHDRQQRDYQPVRRHVIPAGFGFRFVGSQGGVGFQLSTDGFYGYREAVPVAVGSRVDFAQLIKTFSTSGRLRSHASLGRVQRDGGYATRGGCRRSDTAESVDWHERRCAILSARGRV